MTRVGSEPLAPSPDEAAGRALFALTQDAVCLVERLPPDADGRRDYRYVAANPAMLALSGLADLAGRTTRACFPNAAEDWYDDYDRVLATGVPVRVVRRSDAAGPLLQVVISRTDDVASPRLLVMMRELPDAEAISRQAERRYQTLADAIDQGYCTIEIAFDPDDRPLDYRFLEVSPSFERQSGIADAAGRWMRAIAPDHDEHWFDVYGRVALTGEPARFENFSTPLGRWWEVSAFRIDEPARHRVGILFRDISARKAAERALRDSEARLAAAFESVPVGVAVIDTSGRAVVANADYRRFLPTGVIPSRDPARLGRWRAWDERGRPIAPTDFPGARALRGENVAPGQEMLYTDDTGRDIWTTVATVPTRDERGQVTGALSVISDIDMAKRSAEALRASEERQAFLLQLSDTLRPLHGAKAIAQTTATLLGARLGVDRVFYATIDDDGDTATIRPDNLMGVVGDTGGHSPSVLRQSRLPLWRSGQVSVTTDSETDPGFDDRDRADFRALELRAAIAVPLVKAGRLIALLAIGQSTPRTWTDADVDLAAEVAARTWAAAERARAEVALRESEERVAQFAASSSDGLWVRDATTLRMEYTSPAIATIYGVAPDALIGEPERWLALVLPEDRAIATAHLDQARAGQAVVHEFRIRRPSDDSLRWIRNTDFPLHDDRGGVQRIGGIAEDVTDAKQATERQVVLLAELQHRVRNILTVVRSVFARTVEAGGALDDVAGHFTGRLDSLARTQVVVTQSATGLVDLENLIRDELLSVGVSDGPTVTIGGPEVLLPAAAAESIGLAIHELTTNALKYGALKIVGARLLITWLININYGDDRQLILRWLEQGVPAIDVKPARKGFGTELIEEALPYRLGAETKLQFLGGGVCCTISVPLPDETAMVVGSKET